LKFKAIQHNAPSGAFLLPEIRWAACLNRKQQLLKWWHPFLQQQLAQSAGSRYAISYDELAMFILSL